MLRTTQRGNLICRNLKTRDQVTGNETSQIQANFMPPTFQNRQRHSTVLQQAGQIGRRAGTIAEVQGMVSRLVIEV